jgi:hypothetical protein
VDAWVAYIEARKMNLLAIANGSDDEGRQTSRAVKVCKWKRSNQQAALCEERWT